MKVRVVENVLKLNDEIAAQNRADVQRAGVFMVDLLGGPGCGKTSLLEATLRDARGRLKIGVCVGDLTTTHDADRMALWCDHVVQINTGKSCHLEAHQVRRAMEELPLEDLDVLVVENVGNLICPVGFDLGQHTKVGMFSLTEGDDKAVKHPYIVVESDLVLLNKTDAREIFAFDTARWAADVERLHPGVPTLELSATDPESPGLARWMEWLEAGVARTHPVEA